MAIASVLGIALAIALFFFLPTVLFNLLEAVAPGGNLRVALHL